MPVGRKAFASVFLLFALLCCFSRPASAVPVEVYCAYPTPELSEDMFQVQNVVVSGPAVLKEGSIVTVKFDIMNFGQNGINLTDKGIFAAVRDPDDSKRDFGTMSADTYFDTELPVHFESTITIDKKGLWALWPSYEYWKTTYSAPLDKYLTLRKKGPDSWQRCELTVCPYYCEDGVRYIFDYMGQQSHCVYQEETCPGECASDGVNCAEEIPPPEPNETEEDTEAPLVGATHFPTSGLSAFSKINFTAIASDAGNVSSITIYVDGEVLRHCHPPKHNISAGYWECRQQGGPYGAGSHEYWAEAEDAAGNTAASNTSVFSIPLLTPLAPADEAMAAITDGPVLGEAYRDDDGDLVVNYMDECPNTSRSQRDLILPNGCPCEDTDGGVNPWDVGTLSFYGMVEDEVKSYTDTCEDWRMVKEYSCEHVYANGTRYVGNIYKYLNCTDYGPDFTCKNGSCGYTYDVSFNICYSEGGSCADGIRNQGETGVDCGGICPPCNTHCTSGTKYAPPDTPCTTYFPTDTYRVSLPWTDDELEYICQYDEVCHPELDYIIADALSCCSLTNEEARDQRQNDSVCRLARYQSRGSCKRCNGLYIIYGLGWGAKWMKGYTNLYPAHNTYGDIEQLPAEQLINHYRTGICRDYSEAVTTLLRKAGYTQTEVGGSCDGAHCYNVVKLPEDTKFHVVDTTGNGAGIILGMVPGTWYDYCSKLNESAYCFNGRLSNGSACTGHETASFDTDSQCSPGLACSRDSLSIPDWAPVLKNITGCG